MNMLNQALSYAAAGWHVFPLAANQKIPLVGSRGFKDASVDPEKITAWWTAHQDANIGLATGQVSGVWVLDIDQKNGKDGEASLQSFLDEQRVDGAVATKRSKTASGGSHVFFRYDSDRPIGNRANVLPGIDIRGDGGYVVLPPSVTSAGAYVWHPDAEASAVADAPPWATWMHGAFGPKQASLGHGIATKRDRTKTIPWTFSLGFGRTGAISLEQTVLGSKYRCRCPFHDDRSASAFFMRKTTDYGFLYCSACDMSWATEPKVISVNDEIAAIELRLAQLKGGADGSAAS